MSSSSIRVKSIALPAEHGGWSFLLEPIALGLLVAPSLAGAFLAVAVFGAFLLRHPLKLAVTDWRRRRRFARTSLAERFALLYGILALIGLIAACLTAGANVFIPLLLAAPLIVTQLFFDATNRSRDWIPEIAGPAALASAAASLALAGSWPPAAALPLWALMAARAIPAVLYVRARLRLEKGQPFRATPVFLAHIAAILIALALAMTELAPVLPVLMMVILLLRAIYGLLPRPQPTPAKIIGFQELGFGIMTVVLVYLGYAMSM